AGWERSVTAQDPPEKTKPVETKKVNPPPPAPPANPVVSDQTRMINDQLAAHWKANNIQPSGRCTDAEFIRRVSLDIIGRIATIDETKAFLADHRPDKRARLVDKLVSSDQFAANWATIWTIWLMTRGSPAEYRESMHTWLEEQFSKKNQGWDKIVYDLLT